MQIYAPWAQAAEQPIHASQHASLSPGDAAHAARFCGVYTDICSDDEYTEPHDIAASLVSPFTCSIV